jgi:hypothetical protein
VEEAEGLNMAVRAAVVHMELVDWVQVLQFLLLVEKNVERSEYIPPELVIVHSGYSL